MSHLVSTIFLGSFIVKVCSHWGGGGYLEIWCLHILLNSKIPLIYLLLYQTDGWHWKVISIMGGK